MNNADQLCGIRFVFTNGQKSTLFQTSQPKKLGSIEELKTIKIDPSKKIRQVSMKVWNGFAISGMRLIDEEGEHIVDLNWSGVGAWAT